MYVGVQFEAPEGFGSFMKGVRYYLAGDRTDSLDGHEVETVLIVWFAKNEKRWQSWRPHLMTPTRRDFEEALTCTPPKLKVLSRQFTLPVWMEDVDGINFDELEVRRQNNRKRSATMGSGPHEESTNALTYRRQVESRLQKIAAALEVRQEILAAPNPLKAIAATAYDGDKAKHPHRLQLWFFAFVLHGDNEWALKQPTHLNGLWSRRGEKHGDKKFGRDSLFGSCFGWSSAAMRQDIVRYYLDRCGPGVTMQSIHRSVLREEYRCETVADQHGVDMWIQRDNKPFPSYGQFRYVVVDELKMEFVQTQVYGAPRMRQSATANEGNYTEQYANLLEGVEVDAYFASERPKSLYSNDPAERLAVAVGVCATTGAVVGVGFSLGGETGEAYRSMLFCMAVPKDYVARLYGIPQERMKWIMQGLPANFISDRGPAGHRNVASRLEQAFPMKTVAPSYEGQSKAAVESTHPRDVHLGGAPTYILSDLNVVQMMKREVLRAASKNHTKDISARLDDHAIRHFLNEGRVATPHHYWEYLSERLRTSARNLNLEDAVRSFWTPVELDVDKDGVKLRHRHYTSIQFKASGFMKRVGRGKGLQIRGYVLTLVVRYVWVEVDGRLIELEATQRVRVGDEEKNVPLSEMEETANQLGILRSKTRVSVEAATNRAETTFEALTGIPWENGQRRAGAPKKATATVKHEGKVARGQSTIRKAA